MRRVLRLTCDEIRPDGGAIIRRMHGHTPGAPYLNDLAEEARSIIDRVGRPAAVFQRIGLDQFEAIYGASAVNQVPAPLPCVARRSAAIALFAATLGPDVDGAIRARFRSSGALGALEGRAWEASMLDAFTAAACERLAQVSADQFAASLPHLDVPAFPYLPGFCGWDASGAPAVLDRLRPDEIDGWVPGAGLVQPLGFIAGMLVAAPAEVHRTTSEFPCCSTCTSRRCLYRVAASHHAA